MHAEVERQAGARPPSGRPGLDSSLRPSPEAAERTRFPRELACGAGGPSQRPPTCSAPPVCRLSSPGTAASCPPLVGRAQGKASEDGTPSPLARLSRQALLMGSKSKSGLRKLYCYGCKVPLKAKKPGVAPTPSQALPSVPSPPPPPPGAAWSHAQSALGRVNHCKNKDMKDSNWRALHCLLPGQGEGSATLMEFLPPIPRRRCGLSRVGVPSHHPQATPPTQSGTSLRTAGGRQRGNRGDQAVSYPTPPTATTPQNRNTEH